MTALYVIRDVFWFGFMAGAATLLAKVFVDAWRVLRRKKDDECSSF
jgi:hypothetical protein